MHCRDSVDQAHLWHGRRRHSGEARPSNPSCILPHSHPSLARTSNLKAARMRGDAAEQKTPGAGESKGNAEAPTPGEARLEAALTFTHMSSPASTRSCRGGGGQQCVGMGGIRMEGNPRVVAMTNVVEAGALRAVE